MSSPRISCPMPFRFRSEIVRMDSAVKKAYTEAMEMGWDAINQLRRRGVSDEFAAYLLPNAVSIRFTESADLMSLHHKLAMRLCYNAQEEIWRASKDEAEQIREINPRICSRSEEHTSELQSHSFISYAVFCLKK